MIDKSAKVLFMIGAGELITSFSRLSKYILLHRLQQININSFTCYSFDFTEDGPISVELYRDVCALENNGLIKAQATRGMCNIERKEFLHIIKRQELRETVSNPFAGKEYSLTLRGHKRVMNLLFRGEESRYWFGLICCLIDRFSHFTLDRLEHRIELEDRYDNFKRFDMLRSEKE